MIKSIIKFSAGWCSPCQRFKPIFKEVSKMEDFSNIDFSEVDIDEDVPLTEKYHIRSVPTIIFLDAENNVVKRLVGAMSKEDFITAIQETVE